MIQKTVRLKNTDIQPVTLRIPRSIHDRLKLEKLTTGRSVQATVIAALEIPIPPRPHSPDVDLWLATKEQKKKLPRWIVIDRLLVWLMRHEFENRQEVI